MGVRMTATAMLRGAALIGLLSTASPLAAGQLPDAVTKAGVLHLNVNATYPPIEYKDPQTDKLVGLDIDLGEALAKRLGVRIEWTEVAFAQLMPALQTGRTDFILSGLSDLPTRHETMDFIDYPSSSTPSPRARLRLRRIFAARRLARSARPRSRTRSANGAPSIARRKAGPRSR